MCVRDVKEVCVKRRVKRDAKVGWNRGAKNMDFVVRIVRMVRMDREKKYIAG
jgi:hypothetical protein